ncbi:alginate lyase family protein [Gaetbulibacter saemankumensis]|uniref:alginate lyase family protein n=1 Tax=Gaetbulibacter saemankumensis TaxID=311208 RepID=UPI0004233A07|nr:alginate lyase family protein [Gaetbulibacter saemankumensis]
MRQYKLKLLFNTLKYLRFRQVYYRIFYFIKNTFFNLKYTKNFQGNPPQIHWKDAFFNQKSFLGNKTFIFLNLEHNFNETIDWNFSKYGKLWTFNLNYFDFLNQKDIDKEDGVELIADYINCQYSLLEGKESYTISLRGINWVKFLSKNDIQDNAINIALYNYYQRLLNNLELHFLGNHYLENGFSLLFGAYYFQDEKFYKVAKKILIEELNEQILLDGAHFELSPMYHQTILHRVLDCLNLVESNSWKRYELVSFLKKKAISMLSWLQKVTFRNGDIPMVNDSAFGIAPSTEALFKYATFLGLSWKEGKLKESGYRKIEKENYELFIDVGEVGASYLPAHVHSDTFNFELYVNHKPVVVDTGTSTYEKNELRQLERSTASHNTVKVGSFEQSEIWSGFRVAERAKIVDLIEDDSRIQATHNGYNKLNVLHRRTFMTEENKIIIEDVLSNKPKYITSAFFHFHPDVAIEKEENKVVRLKDRNISIRFLGEIHSIEILDYNYAQGFNKKEKAKKLQVNFVKKLKTEISL